MKNRLRQTLGAAALGLLFVAPSFADNPGSHPFYLHALSDLRDARAHLERFSSDPVDHAEERAVREIDAAIGEIKRAAIDDGKNIGDHAPVDAHLHRTDRFHKTLELLDKAQQDVSHREEQSDTRGLQARVVMHIERARHEVRRIIEVVNGS
jgi:hypothetical protein